MSIKLVTSPAVEPITLAQAKIHLRLDSMSLAEDITSYQSIAPGLHPVDSDWGIVGAGVDVSGAGSVLVILNAGTVGPSGWITVKLQDSNDDLNYEDVGLDQSPIVDGVFPVVTEANDSATYELIYSGSKRYLRAIAGVVGADSEFGVSIMVDTPSHVDDSLVSALITAARDYCENFSNRRYITQTWDYYRDDFPDVTEIPLPPLQWVEFIKYKDSAGAIQTVSFLDPSGSPLYETDDYILDAISEPARLVKKNSTGSLTPFSRSSECAKQVAVASNALGSQVNALQIRFVCGYGLANAVPERVKAAIKLKLAALYENRGDALNGKGENDYTDFAIEALLWQDRIVPMP